MDMRDTLLAKRYWREYFATAMRLDALRNIRGNLGGMAIEDYENYNILESMLAREIRDVEADAETYRLKALHYIKSGGL